MTSRIGASRRLAAIAALALVAILPAAAAAHAELVRAIPADGAKASKPVSAVTARYSEDLAEGSSLRVIDTSGATVATGGIDPDEPRLMIARPDQPLTGGTFTVRSTVISADGHVERTEWAFSVTPSPEPTATATDDPSTPPTEAPTPTVPPTPSTPATPGPSPEPGSDTSGGDDAVVLPIIAALAIVLIGMAFLLSRGRRAGGSA